MRGYKKLQENESLHVIESLKDDLATTRLFLDTSDKNFFKDIKNFSYELSVRQFIMHNFGHRVSISNPYIGLTKALLTSLGKGRNKLSYPMPLQWQKILEKNGFFVNRFASIFLWISSVIFFWAYGVFFFLRFFWELLFLKVKIIPTDISQIFFLKDLSVKDYLSYENNSANIINKVLQSNLGKSLILHDNKSLIKQSSNNMQFAYSFVPIKERPNGKKLIVFFLQSCYIIIQSLVKLTIGKWQDALLLKELILANFFSIIPKESIPDFFLFDHSKFVYRPLWTYIVEAKGAKPILYFYSTNNESVVLDTTRKKTNLKWSVMNWPNYWVWSIEQYYFIKRVTSFDANIEIVGPILTGNNLLNKELHLPPRSVAVFDVQPQRDYKYQLLCEPYEYYVPKITNQFLDDIFSIVKSHNATMVYKGKRDIGKMSHYKYRIKLQQLSNEREMLVIDSDNSAESVSKAAHCIISFPFTSTALIGNLQNKPSVYYDPTGKINKLDPAAYGIPIISGPSELNEWLSDQFK
jgi:polysaccharide biosynthesis PFTS motif protein